MAFDKKTEGQPIIQADKPTTQVNLWVVIAVVVFLLVGALALVHIYHNPPQTTQDSLPAAKSGTP